MIWLILEKYSRSQLGHIFKNMTQGERPKWQLYKNLGMKKSTLIEPYLNYNLHERKDGLSDYDFVKSSNGNSLLKTSVLLEDTNWVGKGWVTLPESPPSVLRGRQTQILKSVTTF